MRKGAVITAVVLLTLGMLIFVGGLFAGGTLPPMTYEAKQYTVHEPFSDIRIDTHEADIRFFPSTDGTCTVSGAETEKLYWNVSVQDGALTVTTVDQRNWVDRLMMSADQPLQIRLPEDAYQTLVIESRTGDVELPKDFSFESIEIACSTGDVRCAASASGNLQITTSTGDITLDQVTAQAMMLSVTTGRITVNGADTAGDVEAHVSTGRTELNDLTCSTLIADGSTGRISLNNVVVRDALRITRGTGNVTLTDCDAADITIETSTGDVACTLRSEMYFVTKTDTGKIHVPDTHSGGRCEITTDTGDITVVYSNERLS